MKKTCYLDLDGVLVDFVGAALELHGKALPPNEMRWDFPSQIGFAGEGDPAFWAPLGYQFWANLPFCPEAQSLLVGLESLFGIDVVLLTSPCQTAGCVEGKVDWILGNLPNYRRRFAVCAAKHQFAAPTKLLIDDSDKNVQLFEAAGGGTVLVPRPWNLAAGHVVGEGGYDPDWVVDRARHWLAK